MELKLAKKDFADNFLNIISKAVDVACVKVTKDGLYVLCNKPDTSIILLGKYNTSINIDKELSLNIGDIKKLLRVIDCIEEEDFAFIINSNHLLHKSNSMQFKYHFLDDTAIPKASIKKDKVEALQLDTFFDIDYRKLQEILRASSFTTETNKIYLYGQPDGIYCELGDKETANTDSVSLKVTDKIEGLPLTQIIPFNLDIFRVLTGVKFDNARVGINLKLKIMSFYVKPTSETEFKFIISGLVK
jgi:DNA polymerase III sliding clamp (beta) subunit (PCNA family)